MPTNSSSEVLEITPDSSSIVGSRLRVAFDIDGVIADFVQMMVSAIVALGYKNIDASWRPKEWDVAKELGLTEKQEHKVYELMSGEGIAQKLSPFPGAVKGVKHIAEIADVVFVTTPVSHSKTWCYDRAIWLKEHFGEELGRRWVFCDDLKYLVFSHFFVDDKEDNCEKYQEAWPGATVFRWLSPGMRASNHLLNVKSWDYLYNVVDSSVSARRAKNK